MRILRLTVIGVLIATLFSAAVEAQLAIEASGYQIGPKDKIQVHVLEDHSLDTESRVSDRGTIEIPHVGEVSVAGRTSSEAASVIGTALERFLQKASVTVQILEYMSRPITVIGAVKQPGRLPFSGRWTLIEALTEAGGLAPSAGDAITIRRQARNGLSDQLTVSARDLFDSMDPAVNVPVYANDLINVSSAHTVTVYCTGQVRNPGAQVFRSTESISVVSAISKAGGPTGNASGKITVTRAGGGGQFELRYKRILAGKDDDFPLEDGDLIEVKESFF